MYNPVAHGSPKFQKHWEGPYLVVSKLAGGVTYIVRSVVDDKFLTVHRERLKLCNSEPVQEQDVQLVEAEQAGLGVAQHPQPAQVAQPPINQPAPPPPPVVPPGEAVLPQAVQPAIGAPPQGAQAIQPISPPLMAVPVAPPAAAAPAAGRPRRNVHPPKRRDERLMTNTPLSFVTKSNQHFHFS